MRRKKEYVGPTWMIWEGEDFPHSLDDSVVFFVNEYLDLDEDHVASKALARQLQREGIVETLGSAYALIQEASIHHGGYYYADQDEIFPLYCSEEDPDLDYDATFVEIPYVF